MDKTTKAFIIAACSVVMAGGAYALVTTAWGAYKDFAISTCTTDNVKAQRALGLTVQSTLEINKCLKPFGLQQPYVY